MQVTNVGLDYSCKSVSLNSNQQQNQSIPYSNHQVSMEGKVGNFFSELLKIWVDIVKRHPGFRIF